MARSLMSQTEVDQVLFQLPEQLIQRPKRCHKIVISIHVVVHVLVLGTMPMPSRLVMLSLIRSPRLVVAAVMLITVVARVAPVLRTRAVLDGVRRFALMRVLDGIVFTAVTRRQIVVILEDLQQVLVPRVPLHQHDHPVQRVTDSAQLVGVGSVESLVWLNGPGRPCRQSVLMIGRSQVTFDRISRSTMLHGAMVPTRNRPAMMRARAWGLVGHQDVAVIGCDRP